MTTTVDTVRFTIAYNAADLIGSSALEDLMVHIEVEVTGPAAITVHQVRIGDNAPAWVDTSQLEAAAVREVANHPDEVAARAVDVAGVLTSIQPTESSDSAGAPPGSSELSPGQRAGGIGRACVYPASQFHAKACGASSRRSRANRQTTLQC